MFPIHATLYASMRIRWASPLTGLTPWPHPRHRTHNLSMVIRRSAGGINGRTPCRTSKSVKLLIEVQSEKAVLKPGRRAS